MRKPLIITLAMTSLLAIVLIPAFAASKGKDDNPGRGLQQRSAKMRDASLSAVLLGKKEVDANTGRKRAGDPDGFGSFTAILSSDRKRLCFGLTVKNIERATAAHIHRGSPNQNGPIVLTLIPIPASGDLDVSSGCLDVTDSLADAILKNPRKYYVNVHTNDKPGGAIRGKLKRRLAVI